MYKTFPLSLILKLDAIFTLARHVQLKIMPTPLFKTKRYQILVSKPFNKQYTEIKLETWSCSTNSRLPFAVNVNLNLPINSAFLTSL